MAIIVADRVLETSTTTGTGAYTLLGAVVGFRTAASVCANGDTFTYYAEDIDTVGRPIGGWETGLATWGTGNILTRTTIYASSNSNTAVSWAAGTRRIGLTVVSQARLGPTTINGNLSATNFSGSSSGTNTGDQTNITGSAGRLLSVDSRAVVDTPQSFSNGLELDFKTNTTDGLVDGGTFHAVMTVRQYASGSDWSGGGVRQIGFTDNNNLWVRGANADTTWTAWNKLWHSGNDGIGSGLDADLLDGLTSGQFARSDSTFFAGHHAEGRILANAVLTNDFANARLRGSVFTITNASLSNAQIDAMFDGTSNFCPFTGTGGTFPLIIEFTLPRTLQYGAWIGIGFGNSSWRCNGVKIETFTEGVWVTAIDTSTNFSEDILVNIPGNSAIGTSKVRYTLTNPNSTNIRIAHLWGYNYNSSMWSELMMPKSGGSVYGSISASGNLSGSQLVSNIAVGTPPLVVTSTTVVPNLNADLLDGKNIGTSGNTVPLLDGTNTWSATNTFSGNLNAGNATIRYYTPTDTDIVALIPGSTAGTFIKAQDNAHLVIGIQGNDVNDGFHIINTNNVLAPAPYAKLLLSVTDQTFTYKGDTIWHAGNDGSTSGLDADLLDGNHASAFALSGHTHSYQAADGDLLAIGGLVGTSGLLRKTAADTWSLDTAVYSTTTGTVTSVGGTGTVSGLTLSGSVTTNGNLTLGGTITGFSTTAHNHTLDSLSNTTITSNTSGEILKWNGTAWINNTLAEAGIQPAGSYLTAEADTLATVSNRGNIATSHLILPSGEGNSFGFWGGSTYSIAMGNTSGTYQYGPVSDFSIKMTMSGGAGRGFTWGQRDVKPIAALNSTTGDMQIAGSFSAASKSFLIKHPTKPDMQLRYGSLESPYHGVRLTGEGKVIKGKCTIKLPDYIHGLCKQEGAQVQITNIKHGNIIWVEDIIVDEDYFTVACNTGFFDRKEYEFYWTFTAIRKDISDLEVEC